MRNAKLQPYNTLKHTEDGLLGLIPSPIGKPKETQRYRDSVGPFGFTLDLSLP